MSGLVDMKSLGELKNMTSVSKERLMEILEGQKKPLASKDPRQPTSLDNLQEMFDSLDMAANSSRNPCTADLYLTCRYLA